MGYTTLQPCRLQLQQTGLTQNTYDDSVIASYIEVASEMIDAYCGQHFREEIRTLNQTPRLGSVDLAFRHVAPLISITTLTNGDGTVIPGSGYSLYPGTEYPKQRLVLQAGYLWLANPNASAYAVYSDPDGIYMATYAPSGVALTYSRAYLSSSYAVDGITIAGLWGFNRRGPAAWLNSGFTVGTTTTAGQITLVLNAAGLVIDVGSILRIDSEYFLVTGPVVNTAAAVTLNVLPAQNGSTAAIHNSGAIIYTYFVEPVVELATRKVVAALYQGRNNATGESMMVDGVTLGAPQSMPTAVKQMLPSPYYNIFNGT